MDRLEAPSSEHCSQTGTFGFFVTPQENRRSRMAGSAANCDWSAVAKKRIKRAAALSTSVC